MASISGKYDVVTGTYVTGPDVTGGGSIGQTEGISLEFASIEESIRGDNYGQAIQDAVYRGANCFLDLNIIQADRSNFLSGHHSVTYNATDLCRI